MSLKSFVLNLFQEKNSTKNLFFSQSNRSDSVDFFFSFLHSTFHVHASVHLKHLIFNRNRFESALDWKRFVSYLNRPSVPVIDPLLGFVNKKKVLELCTTATNKKNNRKKHHALNDHIESKNLLKHCQKEGSECSWKHMHDRAGEWIKSFKQLLITSSTQLRIHTYRHYKDLHRFTNSE